jgi:hypothetical protein
MSLQVAKERAKKIVFICTHEFHAKSAHREIAKYHFLLDKATSEKEIKKLFILNIQAYNK